MNKRFPYWRKICNGKVRTRSSAWGRETSRDEESQGQLLRRARALPCSPLQASLIVKDLGAAAPDGRRCSGNALHPALGIFRKVKSELHPSRAKAASDDVSGSWRRCSA